MKKMMMTMIMMIITKEVEGTSNVKVNLVDHKDEREEKKSSRTSNGKDCVAYRHQIY